MQQCMLKPAVVDKTGSSPTAAGTGCGCDLIIRLEL